MAMALLAALFHRAHRRGPVGRPRLHRGGVDAARAGAARLDRQRSRPAPRRASRTPTAATSPPMAPHGIYPVRRRGHLGGDRLPRRRRLGGAGRRDRRAVDGRTGYAELTGRLADQDALDARLAAWTATQQRDDVVAALRAAGVPCAPVQRPGGADRPRSRHDGVGSVADASRTPARAMRVDGLPVHLSETRLADRAGRPAARRAQRAGVRRGARALDAPRSADCAEEGVDLMRARWTGPRGRAGQRARRLRRQAAGRHGRRRDRGRAARRRPQRAYRAVPRRRARRRSGASGGGTTTPPSAAWCSTSTPSRP